MGYSIGPTKSRLTAPAVYWIFGFYIFYRWEYLFISFIFYASNILLRWKLFTSIILKINWYLIYFLNYNRLHYKCSITVIFNCSFIVCSLDYLKIVTKRFPFMGIGWEPFFWLRSSFYFFLFYIVMFVDFEKIVRDSYFIKLVSCID